METELNKPRTFLEHFSFWHNKSDEECEALATNEYGLDAEQALMNMLERDFCTEVNNDIIEQLKNLSKNE